MIHSIPVSACRHYRGWRYGGFGNNLYEDYIFGIENGASISDLRLTFSRRIFGIRGHNMGELLGIALSKTYVPWIYPWSWNSAFEHRKEFLAAQNPDIVCHTSPDGILSSHINREFQWCETALSSIKKFGYKPEAYGFIRVLRLIGNKNDASYLVIDGNHRLSALVAIGIPHTNAFVAGTIRLDHLWRWPGVMLRKFQKEDARAIFQRYFAAENTPIAEAEIDCRLIEDEVLRLTQ